MTRMGKAVAMVLLAALRGEDHSADIGSGIRVRGYHVETEDGKRITRIDIHGLWELAREKLGEPPPPSGGPSDEEKAGEATERHP